jgi:hypothetical protein
MIARSADSFVRAKHEGVSRDNLQSASEAEAKIANYWDCRALSVSWRRVVYTNGNAVFLLHPDGHKERVLSERMIE